VTFPISTEQCAELTGATMRQLQWADENGVISPVHVGCHRSYSKPEVLAVLLYVNLRSRGIGHGTNLIVADFTATQKRGTLPGKQGFLICNPRGKSAWYGTATEAVAVMRASDSPCLLVDLEQLMERIRRA
jgi:hypothetical protein